jgi:hypothetical protein
MLSSLAAFLGNNCNVEILDVGTGESFKRWPVW